MMFQTIITDAIAILLVSVSLFFLVRHFYRVFAGKKSACSCGTKKIIVKDGKVTEETGCGGCCSCCKSKD